MSENMITINKIPSKTWYWLKVNDAKIAWDTDNTVSLGDETITVPAGEARTVSMHIESRSDFSRKNITLEAGKGSSLTVFMDYSISASLHVNTDIRTEAGASVKLVQVQKAADSTLLYNTINGTDAEKSSTSILQLFPGKGHVYSEIRNDLNGDGSEFSADIGYLGQNSQKIDFNLVVNHFGKNTKCRIDANGALKDSASKLFRGTIDFKTGCSGAVGSEDESVLMLGDDVSNRTVPVILCTEEDVMGTHGATIGELDEETLFYFGSRGISREEAEKIMARAALDRLVRMIGSSELEESTGKYIDEVLES